MSFSDFLATIREPALIAVARHWNAARGARRVPRWRDIDPVEMGSALPVVWAWRWDADRDDFVGRLAGEDIQHALGVSIKGRLLREVYSPEQASVIKGHYLQILRVPELAHTHGELYTPLDRNGTVERIVMPLGPDPGRDRDGEGGILGATVYRLGKSAQSVIQLYGLNPTLRRTFPV